MGRMKSTAGGRPHVVAVRLSDAELADLDARRGSLDRSAWLRYLALKARKEGFSMPEVPPLRRR